MKNILILFTAIFLSLTSCKKEVIETYPNMQGTWELTSEAFDNNIPRTVQISILNDGSGKYREYDSDGEVSLEIGGKATIKNEELKILTKKFTITKPPYEAYRTGVPYDSWYVELDGVSYTK